MPGAKATGMLAAMPAGQSNYLGVHVLGLARAQQSLQCL